MRQVFPTYRRLNGWLAQGRLSTVSREIGAGDAARGILSTLELGRDFTLVGEEYPVVAGDDTFRVDLLFFHRRLRCLVATDLKTGKFKPEYAGKCQFCLVALDEQVRLPHEKPSVGLILCKSANGVQMRLALTAAARKIGVATYQTALPEEGLILQRLERLMRDEPLQNCV